MKIAVYCGSVSGTEPEYMAVARKLGDWIGRNGHELVYGGSKTGLMGAVADAVLKHGGRVIGVLPDGTMMTCCDSKKLRPVVVGRTDDMVAISSEVCGINEIMPNRDETQDIYPSEREIVTIDENLEVKRWKQ